MLVNFRLITSPIRNPKYTIIDNIAYNCFPSLLSILMLDNIFLTSTTEKHDNNFLIT